MARRRLFRGKRTPPPLDELGGTADGGLAILDQQGTLIHMTPSRIAASLRYFLARVQLHDAQGMPARLALTSALAGEGVTYVARSIAAAIAYDTEMSVAVIDFNWRRPRPPSADGKGGDNEQRSARPGRRGRGRRQHRRRAGPDVEPAAVARSRR